MRISARRIEDDAARDRSNRLLGAFTAEAPLDNVALASERADYFLKQKLVCRRAIPVGTLDLNETNIRTRFSPYN
jgi:hypothetical protein